MTFDEIVSALRENEAEAEELMITEHWSDVLCSNRVGGEIQQGAEQRWHTMTRLGVNDDGEKFDFRTGQRV
jgi:hypothetical protein